MSQKDIDIVIDDGEFLFAESVLRTYLENLTSACISLETLIENTVEFAIQDVEISDALKARSWDIRKIREVIEGLNSELRGTADAFIKDIDHADSFVY